MGSPCTIMARIRQPPVVDDSHIMADLDDPIIRAKADEFNERYLHWDEVQYRVDEDIAERVWAVMKHIRRMSAVRMDLCGMEYRFCMLPSFTGLLHYIDRDASGIIEPHLNGGRDAKRYLISSLMEESIASSQMEGAATTRMDAKRMIRSGRGPRNKDERMVLNNYVAMGELKGMAQEELTPALIRRMHRTIVSGTLGDGAEWEGKFRESDDIVVGDALVADAVYHIPPGSSDVPRLIDELCDFANNDDRGYIHPIIKAIILHYAIGYIHPFVDGNGRLARSLFYWYAIRSGYWLLEYASISSVIKGSRGRYGLAYRYTESDENDLTYFIRYNLECIRDAIEGLSGYMERKSMEQRERLESLPHNPGLSLLDVDIMRDLAEDPHMFSLEDIRVRYGISYQTARVHVLGLVDSGHLKVVGRDRKKVLYSLNDKSRGHPITSNYWLLVN